MKNKKSELIKTAEIYEGFIRDGKVLPSNQWYPNQAKKLREWDALIREDKMTPEIFKKMNSRERWDVARELHNVEWMCEECGSEQGIENPKRMFVDGSECCCNNCDHELTRRTPGGQGDPFNYTFKIIANG